MKSTKLKKGLVAAMLALSITGMTVSNVPNIVTNGTAVSVEAASKKKDKKKPKITFKGKTKLTAYKNKSVKIPKTTAKDNKDGNVTKKIKVTVKKGKKSYKSIAKKIKNNKSVKFTSTGKYVITYTVTDKAGNKATKKRYVTVKNQPKKAATTEEKTETQTTEATTEKTTTEQPTTEKPTEATTQERPTTEATTETPTTEDPKPETPTVAPTDYSKYDINEVTFNNIKYKVTSDEDFADVIKQSELDSNKINLVIDNEYSALYINRNEEILTNSEYLKFLGSIKATDKNGNDISDRIVVYEKELSDKVLNGSYTYAAVYIYVEDSFGNKARKYFNIEFCNFDAEYQYYVEQGYTLLSYDPIVFGKLYPQTTSLSNVSSQAKKLELTY